jgi:hypothetical protein
MAFEASAAQGEDGQGERVVTGEDAEAERELGKQFGDLNQIAAGFLDADDVGNLGEAEDRGGLQVGTGATGDVVEQDWQVGGLGDGLEVLILALLAGTVVVGVCRQDSGEAVDL